MFKLIYQWILRKLTRESESASVPTLVRVHFKVDDQGTVNSEELDEPTSGVRHDETIAMMPLEQLKLCSLKRCERLREHGIETAGDLLEADAELIAKHFSAKRKAKFTIRRYQRAIRVSASIPEMMPADAMLLFNVHRRHARTLALDSPLRLRRDMERYSESSQGREQLRGRALPSVSVIKTWIDHCSMKQRLAAQECRS